MLKGSLAMRRVCVFAGSSSGARSVYGEAARALGTELARRRVGLVYGGSSSGLMGAVADAVLVGGGEVIGVMPQGLFRREVAHLGLTELREVGSMHERKALMADLADAFIALPGGYGTFDELFEIVTWTQIGISERAIGLLDVAEYFAPLLAMVEHAAREGFIPASHVSLLAREDDPGVLLDRLAAYIPPKRESGTWLPRP